MINSFYETEMVKRKNQSWVLAKGVRKDQHLAQPTFFSCWLCFVVVWELLNTSVHVRFGGWVGRCVQCKGEALFREKNGNPGSFLCIANTNLYSIWFENYMKPSSSSSLSSSMMWWIFHHRHCCRCCCFCRRLCSLFIFPVQI